LSEAAAHARKKKVILKGDLPIGVDRNSVDTWVYPTLFRMDTATGAPPDYFDKNGQNWGFPTYNWEEMSKDNYGWWRARLTQVIYLPSQMCVCLVIFSVLLFISYFYVADVKVLHSIQDRPHIGFL
jgi:4-alpha-glucanotransferase